MRLAKSAAVLLPVLLAGCASSAPKKDPYAQAAATKRAEIDRLSSRIDSLRVLPSTEILEREIDSLRALRSLEVGNLQGIGQAAEIRSEMSDTTGKILNYDREIKERERRQKAHPIQ